MIQEFSILNSQFSILNSYVWGLDLSGSLQGAGGVGGLLSVISPLPPGEGPGEGSTAYLPCYDANGNVMEYVSTDGTIAAHREYDPFGGTIVIMGDANAFTHWFSTKPWCSITGLSEYQYRKYSPELGRWFNRDSMEESGGANLYRFCRNDGKNIVDVLGENTIWFKEATPAVKDVNDTAIIGPGGQGRTIPTTKHVANCTELVNGKPRCWIADVTLTMEVVRYILVNPTRTQLGIAKTRRHEALHRQGFSDAFDKYEALYAPILVKTYISQNGGFIDCSKEVKTVFAQVDKSLKEDYDKEVNHDTRALSLRIMLK